MAEETSYSHARWAKQFDEITGEIAKYASICRVNLLDSGNIQRVLNDDATVCGIQNESAFRKMRSLLMLHYSVRQKAVAALGPQETLKIVDEIVARLRAKLGQ
jgi:hypothetical protein